MMKFRSALVPVVNLCSNAWIIIFMIGLFAGAAGGAFIKLAIIMFAATLLFQLVTLPVEFDASRRGLTYLKASGMNSQAPPTCFVPARLRMLLPRSPRFCSSFTWCFRRVRKTKRPCSLRKSNNNRVMTRKNP